LTNFGNQLPNRKKKLTSFCSLSNRLKEKLVVFQKKGKKGSRSPFFFEKKKKKVQRGRETETER